MILRGFVDRFYRSSSRGDSAQASVKTGKNEFNESSTRNDPQIEEKNGIILDKGVTRGIATNELTEVKFKDNVGGSKTTSTTNSPRLISRIRRRSPNRENPIEKPFEFDDTKGTNVSNPVAQRRTMSRRKFEAVTASIALKARNEVEEKRRKAYEKAMGQLRIGFVDSGGTGSDDDDSFDEDFEMFLDEEQKEQERKERERDCYWHHSFRQENQKKKKTKKLTKQNDESANSSDSSPFAEVILHATVQRLHRQYVSFAKNLPISPAGSIFVRVPEQRLDLPRILITGPHGTPYANGLFFFDFWAKDYPNSPPRVRFLTTGNGSVRFNPNLYNSGKVCLSLLGTWRGPGWNPGKSNLLQVLLSCQGLVLGTAEPFYNEPGYGSYKDSPQYQRESNRYNKEIRKQTLRWAILDPLKKIVLQEERIDTRKRFLKKLKEQRLKEKDVPMATAGHEDERDDTSSKSPSSIIPTSNPDKTKNGRSTKRDEKKSKWRAISNLWSGTPQPQSSLPSIGKGRNEKNWEDMTLIPSDMPPRKTYEYSEFSAVVIGHFLGTADYIEEQLQSWHEADPRGTKYYVDEIRKWQKRLLELVNSRKQLQKDAEEADTDGRDPNIDTRVEKSVPTNRRIPEIKFKNEDHVPIDG